VNTVPQLSPRTKRLSGLYESARPGYCIVCDLPLPRRPKGMSGRKPVMCGEGCAREYRRLFRAEMHEESKRTLTGRTQALIFKVTRQWGRLAQTVAQMAGKGTQS